MTAKGQMTANSLQATEIVAILSCFWVTPANKKQYRPGDKKWRLVIQTDPGCKRPMVRRAQELPFWCNRCQQELQGNVRVCQRCSNCALCYLCSQRDDHDPSHPFISVDLGNHPEIPAFSQPRVRTSAVRTGGRIPRKNLTKRAGAQPVRRAGRPSARAAPPSATPRAEPGPSSSTGLPPQSSVQRQRRLRVTRTTIAQPEAGSSSRTHPSTASPRPRPRHVPVNVPPAAPQPDRHASGPTAANTAAPPAANREAPTRFEESETLAGFRAWQADFPESNKPFRIYTDEDGRQSAWEALVTSWRAQRGRLEAERGTSYRDITEKELEDTFNNLLLSGAIPPDAEFDDDSREAAIADTLGELLYQLFGLFVQLAYVSSPGGQAIFVPVGTPSKTPHLRLWVFNHNGSAVNWAGTRFHGIGIKRQARPSQSLASGGPSQRPSEHGGNEVDDDGSSRREEGMENGEGRCNSYRA